jgi:sulfur relay (sulfurtransferase) DsrF/TusC family protein
MNEIIFLVEDSPDGGLSARALGHAIFTSADTEQQLHLMVRDAVACHFEEGQAPKIIRLHSFVKKSSLLEASSRP